MNTTHSGARAQTRMHPDTRRPDHARTHAPAHEHACMRTHARKHTRTCKHAHAHPRYALDAVTYKHAPAQRACMHTHAVYARMYPHNAHTCARTRTREHACLAGWCQWEWWRSLRSPAGRAIPCIKLLPLPPPRGLHVSFPEGMVSCKPGRVLEPDICVLYGLRWMQSRCGSIGRRFSPRLQTASTSLLVSFSDGMVSCEPGPELVQRSPDFCWFKYLPQCWCGCMGRRIPWWRRCKSAVDQAGV